MKRELKHGVPLYFLNGPDCLDLLELFIHLEFGLTREDLIDECTDLGIPGLPQNKILFDQSIDAVEFQQSLMEENFFEQMEEDDGTSPSWDEIAEQETEAIIEDEEEDKYKSSEEEEFLFSFKLIDLAGQKQTFYVLKTHIVVYTPEGFSRLIPYHPLLFRGLGLHNAPLIFEYNRFH